MALLGEWARGLGSPGSEGRCVRVRVRVYVLLHAWIACMHCKGEEDLGETCMENCMRKGRKWFKV